MRTAVFLIVLLMISSCAGRLTDDISDNVNTVDALMKYSSELQQKKFLVFPEIREYPLKWFDSIPEKRIPEGLSGQEFTLTANPGEYFVFQLGVWALHDDLENIEIEYSGLKGNGNKMIPASSVTCFNKGGIDFKGDAFAKTITTEAGRVQALWFGVDLSEAGKGTYRGVFSVLADGEKQTIPVKIKVNGEKIANHGYDEGSRLSRLSWLNSTAGMDEEVTKGYTPVKVEESTIKIFGRDLTIGPDGLPSQIVSYFTNSNQALSDNAEPVVKNPFRFIIQKAGGQTIILDPGEIKFTETTPAKTGWTVLNTSDEFDLEVTGQMEFDGYVDYRLKLTAKSTLKINDIRLEVPVVTDKAEYMMGLDHEGGYRTPDWKWNWDTSKNQDMIWIGSVTGGLRLKLKAENYRRPLINVYYAFYPLNLPPSWGNHNKGGVNVGQKGDQVLVNAYSGSREMNAGEVLNFDFELLITPFKLIDKNIKFNDRYFHGGGVNASAKPDMAIKAGANIINIHHAEDIYPFINYPYLDANIPELKALINDVHNKDLRIKFYYTTRELTKNLPEFWPFYSLNGEVLFPGPGNESRTVINPKGPNEWLVKNLREKYIPAWHNPIEEGKFKGETDLSVITTPDSRLNNFYISGLDWMVKNLSIDGVYIDDSALDRLTLMRARKVIDNTRPEGRIDLHSWNHFNDWAGWTNCLNLYMDMLPYFDLVWIGEGRDYNRAPDHWLVEVSGIPFGLPGQMLEGGGNPWRGMVYGITNRAGWVRNSPEHLWKFFDDYRLSEKELAGYWDSDCPVKCNNNSCKASLFRGSDSSVIAVANWTDKNNQVTIDVDWNRLGINPEKVGIFMPAIKDFQEEKENVSLTNLIVPGFRGFLIVLKNK